MVPKLEQLRQQVEELAIRLVVGEAGGATAAAAAGWFESLERIRDEALREQAGGVAEIAGTVLETLHRRTADAGGEGPEINEELQAGVMRLQQAIESTAAGNACEPETLAQDPELLADFVLESREHLAKIENEVLKLERDPRDSETLNAVFRGFHTIKGLAGFLELWEIQKLAHEVETVLDRARNAELTITPAAIDVVLASADHLRRWLLHLELAAQQKDTQAPAHDAALLARIRELSATPSGSNTGGVALEALAEALEAPRPEPVKADAPGAAPAKGPDRAGRRSEALAVKVDTAKLDYLVDMAGEMVIAESLVRHDPELAALKSPKVHRNLAQLTRITTELQKTAMAMRLVPIGPLFRRMARLVRDLSRQFNKNVEMVTAGDDIELDRNIVEELADPFMHMVRNAIDHGIEPSGERVHKGKSPSARLALRAQHRAGQVVIEISDDGRGLDRERIVAKAIERGLIGSGDGLSDPEVFNLIFEPGFSTAAQVTNVSGRGVGMDVVRRHIEKLRGRIEIRSTPGQGTCFLLKLPLTLAIIDGLVVGVGQERYIVPLFAVREMFRPKEETIWTVQQRAEMALVRGGLLPVLRLYRKFHVEPRSEDPRQSVLVVAEAEGQRFCLLVDELVGKQEVVIKTLGETFKNVTGIAGGAILGDGRVGLILDLDRLCKDRTGDTAH
jgi:two-component system, chemotaxis family, sensor kinase CheA